MLQVSPFRNVLATVQSYSLNKDKEGELMVGALLQGL